MSKSCAPLIWTVGLALTGSARALGSDSPQPANVQAALVQNQQQPVYTGSSLLKATMSARPDPQQAKLDDVSLFAVPAPEPRTMKKHDLVTIIVREESEYSSEGNTELSKEFELNATIEELVKLNLAKMQINPGGVGDVPLEVRMNGDREFTGEGSVDRSDTFTTRITSEVTDVKPNGTLVVQGRLFIKTDEEEKEITISGTCRAEDVSVDNTILSSQLYDTKLITNHKGAVRDSTKRGWIPRLLDLINPF
jgi:flagellar L-ring protein precursor FlgH